MSQQIRVSDDVKEICATSCAKSGMKQLALVDAIIRHWANGELFHLGSVMPRAGHDNKGEPTTKEPTP